MPNVRASRTAAAPVVAEPDPEAPLAPLGPLWSSSGLHGLSSRSLPRPEAEMSVSVWKPKRQPRTRCARCAPLPPGLSSGCLLLTVSARWSRLFCAAAAHSRPEPPPAPPPREYPAEPGGPPRHVPRLRGVSMTRTQKDKDKQTKSKKTRLCRWWVSLRSAKQKVATRSAPPGGALAHRGRQHHTAGTVSAPSWQLVSWGEGTAVPMGQRLQASLDASAGSYRYHWCSLQTTSIPSTHLNESPPTGPPLAPRPRPPRIEVIISLLAWWCVASSNR